MPVEFETHNRIASRQHLSGHEDVEEFIAEQGQVLSLPYEVAEEWAANGWGEIVGAQDETEEEPEPEEEETETEEPEEEEPSVAETAGQSPRAQENVTEVPGIGASRAETLSEDHGIETAGDLAALAATPEEYPEGIQSDWVEAAVEYVEAEDEDEEE